jgi:very-short-patch-repair endonuclease
MRNASLQRNARRLRSNATDAERHLWRFLRLRHVDGFRFRRQVPVGQYIADFACIEAKLIVEVDGGQHQDNPRDVARDAKLKGNGFKVLRFWNNQVLLETEAVLEEIARNLASAKRQGSAGEDTSS